MNKIVLAVLAIGLSSSAFAWTQKEAYGVLIKYNFDLFSSSFDVIKSTINYFSKGIGSRSNTLTGCSNFLADAYDLEDKFDVEYAKKMIDEATFQISPNGQKLAWTSQGMDGINAFKSFAYYTEEYIQKLCTQETPASSATNTEIVRARQDMRLSELVLNGILRELR